MMGTESIWVSLPVPALIVDDQTHIVDVNSAAETFFNTSAKMMRDAPLWDRVTVEMSIRSKFMALKESGLPLFVNDIDVGSPARAPIQCSLQIAPLQGQAGHLLILVTPREFGGAVFRRDATGAALKSAIGMAEMLAHEIKNPLAGITGAAQLLGMKLDREDRELTDLIVAESRRIVKLLEQVEQFGNNIKPELVPLNIHDVLDRARRSAMLGFAKHMRIVEAYDPSLPFVNGDIDRLVQLVMNLLKNASEAADPKGGTITLRSYFEHSFRMRRADGSGHSLPLQIEVIDDGPGLPEDIAENIFEPFVSGRENGTGLGLALVSKIVAEHNGWVSVHSKPGQTVFRLSLPRAQKTDHTQAGSPMEPRIAEDENDPLQKGSKGPRAEG